MEQKVSDFRKRIKKDLMYIHGNECCLCGYNKSLRALSFHHINENEKSFALSDGNTRSFESSVEESKKCILVCANCHAEIHDELISKELVSSFDENKYLEIISNRDTKTYCKECGKQITSGATYCQSCEYKKRRIVERPSREELKSLIRNFPFTKIGERYEVSDNTIRKWCKSENLPTKKSDINSYSDFDWEKI